MAEARKTTDQSAKLDERVARGEAGQGANGQERRQPEKLDFSKVKIKNRGDVVEQQRIDDIIVGKDGNGQVTFVDFGGADIETE